MAAAESADGDATAATGPPKESVAEFITKIPSRPWKIPETMEKGVEIPIGLTSTEHMPKLGEFER